jgi:LysM repeat protein
MQKIIFYINFFLIFILATSVQGQNNIKDGIFVEMDKKLGKITYHRTHHQETLYGVARLYNVQPSAIKKYNPKSFRKSSNLPPVLKIPIFDDQIIYRIPIFKSKRDYIPVYYEAQPKDNLFRVSRIYFSMPTNLLKNRNRLNKDALKKGQVLHIGWMQKTVVPLLVEIGKEKHREPEIAGPAQYGQMFEKQEGQKGVRDKNEVAFWNKENQSAKGYFVMHRFAEEKSIIEITNPMFDTKVYAKVIGNIPDHLYPKEIDMVVSGEIASSLKVMDARFFVRSRYISRNNY